ncbi:MAG: hypothetical protein ACQEQU_05305 [Spirochaetota bacterium]
MNTRLVGILTILLVCVLGTVTAAEGQFLEEADALYEAEEYKRGLSLLEGRIDDITDKQLKAQTYWRMARFTLFIGDDMKQEGASKGALLDTYSEGIKYAEKAVDLQPSADAYYWRSSNTGRWGETKGILNSLSKAKPMHADLERVVGFDSSYADAWFVFGKLYYLLPGGFISFGNTDYAVSYARRAIEVYQEDDLKISYYKSLAEILYDRDWSRNKRRKEYPGIEKDFSNAKTLMEQMRNYEGFLAKHNYKPGYAPRSLSQMSDREEARAIVEWVTREYEAIASPTRGERQNMQELRDMVEEEWD